LGGITVGVYVVRLDNTATFFAFDIDINKRALAKARGSLNESRRLRDLTASEGRRLQAALSDLGIPSLMENSGYKGRHLWCFLEIPEAAAVVHQFGVLFLEKFPLESRDLHVEFFPKQAAVGSGVGNLIKLPLGIHRRTGRRSYLLRPDGTAEQDPHGALRRQQKVAREALHAAIGVLKASPAVSISRPSGEGESEGDEPAAAHPATPAPPTPPPAWTAADFETNPEISHLMSHCPVLNALKEKVDKHRRLNHDEQIVLAHGLGHSGPGVLAVNYLFDACVDIPPTARLQSRLSGNPVSCPKIRKRIPHITGSVPCNCSFDFAPNQYPNPRLHLLTLDVSSKSATGATAQRAAPAWDPVDRARALGVLWVKRQELASEIEKLEKQLMDHMSAQGLVELDTGEGRLVLHHEEGAPPALGWEARAPAASEVAAPNNEPEENRG
jgi:hypothetical protein